jgi:hypothetical protein
VTEIAPVATNNPWAYPLAPTQPPSLSERLIRALEAHASAEAHDLATCEQLAQRSRDPIVKLLMGIILEDEQRHHALLRSMVRRLQDEVECVASPTALPVAQGSAASGDGDTAATLRGLMRDEHEAAHHLRHIAHQESHLFDGLYPLLLDTMARDSDKHATILRYLLRRAEERCR